MSNVHGMNDFNQNNRRPRQRQNQASGVLGFNQGFQGLTIEHLQAVQTYKVLFLSGRKKVKNPRDENYFDMLKDMCCPVCKLLSLTTIMLIIYLIIFIVEASIGLNKQGQLLEINEQTLIKMGANSPRQIKHGAVWRLITAAVLHVNFIHFLGNFTSTIILLSRFQYSFGTIRCIIIYIISAISGNIFSALCQPSGVKAGASTCLYGLLGVMIGYLIINWNGLNRIGPINKCQLVCICFMLFIFTLLFTSAVANIDYFGHLGGFLAGIWLSGINKTIQNQSYQRKLQIGAIIILILQLTIFFVLFYTLTLK